MCSYKVIKVFFEVWGLQGKVESGVHRVQYSLNLWTTSCLLALQFHSVGWVIEKCSIIFFPNCTIHVAFPVVICKVMEVKLY